MHLAIIGYGNIGRMLVRLIAEHGPPLERLTLLVRAAKAREAGSEVKAIGIAADVAVASTAADLISRAPDLAIECAGQAAVRDIVHDLLAGGIDTVIASIGALADAALETRLMGAAQAGQAQLILPAGAIGGIDMLAALRPSGITSVRYTGRKPPLAWKGSPAERQIDLDGLTEATSFFDGNAREAARLYPKNANVAATLALAGIGMEATKVSLIADPEATGNLHSFEVSAGGADFRVEIAGKSSPDNPRTSIATVYSLLREVQNRAAPRVI